MRRPIDECVSSASHYRIEHARIITPTGVIENGSVTIADGRIVEVAETSWDEVEPCIDGRGQYLLPGFIDIHGDSLERAIAPRPSAPFPPELVLPAYDAELAVHGITTMYHCVAIADLGEISKPLRCREKVAEILQSLHCFISRSRIRTRLHLRYEILDVESLPIIREMVANQDVHLLSLMDHTPGYGVFKDLDAYRRYRARSGSSVEATEQMIRQTLSLRAHVDEQALQELIALCHQHQIVVASHDDHTREKIVRAKQNGIDIAEFPVTMEAVRAAREMGLYTVFGAANLVRGGSHAENLSTSDMIAQGMADIICSDYSPMCLLQGLFKAAEISDAPFHEVVNLFTLNPARAVGIGDWTGSIEPGKTADLILVNPQSRVPEVTCTIVNGRSVFATC
jgi:alpha-D-ribose 1-methylphosphonate 5-triphosphate diphosphatase